MTEKEITEKITAAENVLTTLNLKTEMATKAIDSYVSKVLAGTPIDVDEMEKTMTFYNEEAEKYTLQLSGILKELEEVMR